ncbi:MAG: chromate resistance protein ChrB domain-containing protein [Bdellovibrionota bacterium]
MAKKNSRNTWLLLMHQLPPKPESLRVKVWRSLQRLGALPIKNSVYALPNASYGQRALAELAKEIHAGGGEAIICESEFIQGVNTASLIEQYNQGLEETFASLSKEIQAVTQSLRKVGVKSDFMEIEHHLGRARSLLKDTSEKNTFRSPAEEDCRELLEKAEKQLATFAKTPKNKMSGKEPFKKRTWVTRADIRTDRMASAWLIKRHIDVNAKFAFVSPKEGKRSPSEIRFDMFGAEFTHEGELCTFEVLLEKFSLISPALVRLGKIIHDLDIKDDKYGLPETPGVEIFLGGLAKRISSDEPRLKEAFSFFDSLEASFQSKNSSAVRK